ncbi:MAG: tetratricopeptide repeat protein [Woeseiaceae bacterium]
MRIVHRCFLLSLAMAFLTACTGLTIAPDSRSLSTEELLRAEPLTGPTDVPELEDIDVLALDQDMRDFLNEHVNPNRGYFLKMHDLIYAMISDGTFGLEYDESTRTAEETFHARHGNCLSFTNMFVAMAREVGIDASFQEIEIPPSWSVDGDTYTLSRHVNVFIDLGAGYSREVDFNIDDWRGRYERRLISDERALAHYYSNIGAEYLRKDAPLEALRYFRKALAVDPKFAPAWSNLGALYSDEGHYSYAEAAYVRALRVDPHELVAMSNLGQLYTFKGQLDLADWYNEKSDRHRMRNPYYRYDLAESAFVAEDYETAIKHLKYSLRKEKNEDTFYFLLGLSYLQLGNEAAARKSLEKAELTARDVGLKNNYHSKMESLLGTH